MVTIRKYANNITQTTGLYTTTKKYRAWSYGFITALKKDNSWATCGGTTEYTAIGGKNGTWDKPAPLTFKNFNFNIPSSAKITNIKIGYTHKKNKIGGAYGSFNAPTITILNVSNVKGKGYAVSYNSKSFTTNFNVNLSASTVNSNNFGVKISYPSNSNTNLGQIQLKNVYIEITYNDYNFHINSTSNSSEKYIDSTEDITVNLNSNNIISSYSSNVTFNLPAGVSFVKKVAGNGSIKYNGNIVNWTGIFSNTKNISITFRVQFNTSGNKTFTFKESSMGATNKLIIPVSKNNAKLIVDFDNVQQQSTNTDPHRFEIRLTVNSKKALSNVSTVHITFPSTLIIHDMNTAYGNINSLNNNEFNFTPSLNNEITDSSNELWDVAIFSVSCSEAGKQKFTTIFKDETNDYYIKFKPKELTVPYYVKISLDEHEIDRLGDGEKYNIHSIMKLVMDSENEDIYDAYDYNYRLGVFNSIVTDTMSELDYFSKAEWSSPISSANKEEKVTVNFVYDDNYPVIIFITGEYLENSPRSVNLEYTYPCFIELKYDNGLEEPGLFPYPIKKLYSNEETCQCVLNTMKTTNRIRIYDLDLSGLSSSDTGETIVQGVTVDFDINCDSTCTIVMKLINGNKEGNRSINISSIDGKVGTESIGGKFDLWGLNFTDFDIETLDDIELELILLNPFPHDSYIEINNVQVTFHYIEVPDSVIHCKVNDIDLRYYNLFIKSVEVPFGTDNEVKYLEVSGTDSNLAYRSNIQSKEIKIDFIVPGCDIIETTAFVERLGKLFANERDKFNRPILNTIEFSHFPDRVWNFVIEDAIEANVEYTEYEGTIKLIVPSGTSETKSTKITNNYGTNSSIAKINPEIYLSVHNTEVIITEYNTKQQMIIRDDTFKDDLLKIDCANRTVYKLIENENDSDYTSKNITDKVDFNSDWFSIYGDYNFQTNNTASIQSINFKERW